MQEVMTPVLTKVGNEILQGKEPPPSFLDGLGIPLKNGDSTNAMDYRPTTLLQTFRYSDSTTWKIYSILRVPSRNNRGSNVNCVDKIMKIQRRLVIAWRVATSDEDRTEVLNSIVLPAVLFTSAVFPIPVWAANQLLQLQNRIFAK
ncbi:RxLR effector candidate protein [Phytophthora palmivora]|uniref:RxLR effector candidate protein n=1 Tax=Phytophthora palmivora TaxID=4796 RepID=A0A2P4XZL4_9STRA|nr:RxLR effector candidate protein [Phytophthora palmivora]